MSSIRVLLATVSLACLMPFAASADSATSSSGQAPVTHAELPDLVKQAIMDHPEIIMQAAQKAQMAAQKEADAKSAESLKKHKSELLSDTSSPSVGPKNANVTILEFFDYHCGYCKHMLPTVTQLLGDDKKVRVVFKEFPILAEDSITASRAALAVNHIAPDKYFEFHTALMKSNGKFDESMLMDTAKTLGIDGAKLKAEMAKPAIAAELDKDKKLGEELGIRGTPALIIGDKLYPGAIPYDDLKKIVADIRSGKNPDDDKTISTKG